MSSISWSARFNLVLMTNRWIFLQAIWFDMIREQWHFSLRDLVRTVRVILKMWTRSNVTNLDFVGHQPRLVRTCLWGLIWELQKKIKHQIKVDMNRQLRARHVADKSNQSCPVHHLTSNKITSINNLLYDWLDFVCLVQVQGRRGGTTQFSQWLKLGQIALITSKTLL